MHGKSWSGRLTALLTKATVVVSCAGLLVGSSIVPNIVNAEASTASQYNPTAIAGIIHLEVHLQSRQAILYQGGQPIKRYTIGIGRQGWETPVGTFRILQMQRDPIWINPFTNEKIAATDPRNPLRGYWIGFWTNGKNWIGFHGTLDTATVGKDASHGCIHMRKSDLQELFSLVSLGTQVIVVQ